ncbi:N-acetylmuramoyl-L-alanine amidase [Spirochaeta africana]|uniref:N-acetylmuramoyl-L-alanine amidase n=1 Tax=Spirochaeta africana (strain ATCC 700263 / DSM 8902 / Z-7692) TaxID=889378 RepID=H9UMB3_SPIAZ|nr:N-acetylmuramoyl-L-alanine amidase [Spirochaeta africana]AFG38656.1 N-acetylmuramoyl-L-alanine amidase [Spirochaeta africana DSM 8902]
MAIQPGHWQIEELPDEHAHRRTNIGAVYQGVREVDIALAVTAALQDLLEAEGWQVQVVPATVPPGLQADAFISIHADWARDTGRSGWKLAPPWRASPAGRMLAASLHRAFTEETGLREDVAGITVGMRGYFGFAAHRFEYAASPYTPAILVELGFVTNTADRRRMTEQPEYYAGILHRGLREYFSQFDRSDTALLTPPVFEPKTAGPFGATAYRSPDASAAVVQHLSPLQVIRPIGREGEWYEVRIRTPALSGWIHQREIATRQEITALPVRSLQ